MSAVTLRGLAFRFPGIATPSTLRALRQMGATCLDDCRHIPRGHWGLTAAQTDELLTALVEHGRGVRKR